MNKILDDMQKSDNMFYEKLKQILDKREFKELESVFNTSGGDKDVIKQTLAQLLEAVANISHGDQESPHVANIQTQISPEIRDNIYEDEYLSPEHKTPLRILSIHK